MSLEKKKKKINKKIKMIVKPEDPSLNLESKIILFYYKIVKNKNDVFIVFNI